MSREFHLSGDPFLREQILPEIFDRCEVALVTMPVPTVDTFHTTLHRGTTCEFHKFST